MDAVCDDLSRLALQAAACTAMVLSGRSDEALLAKQALGLLGGWKVRSLSCVCRHHDSGPERSRVSLIMMSVPCHVPRLRPGVNDDATKHQGWIVSIEDCFLRLPTVANIARDFARRRLRQDSDCLAHRGASAAGLERHLLRPRERRAPDADAGRSERSHRPLEADRLNPQQYAEWAEVLLAHRQRRDDACHGTPKTRECHRSYAVRWHLYMAVTIQRP